MATQTLEIKPEDTALFRVPSAIVKLLREGVKARSLLPPDDLWAKSTAACEELIGAIERDPSCLERPETVDQVCTSMNGTRYALMDCSFPKRERNNFPNTSHRCFLIEIGLRPGTYDVSANFDLTFPSEWE